MSRTPIKVKLTLTEEGLDKFKRVPLYNNTLFTNQILGLVVGENIITLNKFMWDRLEDRVKLDKENMQIEKIEK